MKLYTIGHSNLDFKTFLNLLFENKIEVIIDVRKIPRSKFEHFNSDFLENELPRAGIEYFHAVKLGGFRKKIFEKSPNTAIKSQGFRNYADFMLTEEFEKEIEKVIEVARRRIVALMCAEKFFWKCHRKFLADYLAIHGFKIFHIIDNKILLHKVSKNASIHEGKLIYNIEI
ncbi:MAG: DUF488 domain-containing protein [Archaeoglobaceae archaeon]|nr:DUF488 domain-containing protein [Archaeoglobales archaeon]